MLMPPALPDDLVVGAPPERTIQISIGRIDVRAGSPAASAPRTDQPRERRIMSLEDYLERRARGTSE